MEILRRRGLASAPPLLRPENILKDQGSLCLSVALNIDGLWANLPRLSHLAVQVLLTLVPVVVKKTPPRDVKRPGWGRCVSSTFSILTNRSESFSFVMLKPETTMSTPYPIMTE